LKEEISKLTPTDNIIHFCIHNSVSPLVAVVPSLATLATGRNLLVFVLNEGNETNRSGGV